MDVGLRPLGLLLLPAPLEDFELRDEAEELRSAGRFVAVDPPRIAYSRLATLPAVLAEVLAQGQARRLVKALRRRDDVPLVVVIFEPEQYPIARGVLHRAPESELWFRRPDDDRALSPRVAELHDQAAARATLTLPAGDAVIERLLALGLVGG